MKDKTIQTNWIVVSGAPSSGKTTIANILKTQGYKIVDEIARQYICELIEQGIDDLSAFTRTKEFQKEMVHRKLLMVKNLDPNALIVIDSGLIEAYIYHELNQLRIDSELDATLRAHLECYRYKCVLLMEMLPFVEDGVRFENEVQRRFIFDSCANNYEYFGYKPVYVPQISRTKEISIAARELLIKIEINGQRAIRMEGAGLKLQSGEVGFRAPSVISRSISDETHIQDLVYPVIQKNHNHGIKNLSGSDRNWTLKDPNGIFRAKKIKNLFVISGPYGVGKSSLIQQLTHFYPIEKLVAYSTRPARDDEIEGIDYRFISQERFAELQTSHALLHSIQVFENDYGHLLSEMLEKLEQGQTPILELNYDSLTQVSKVLKELAPDVEIISIFISPPNKITLQRRLEKRGGHPTDIEDRYQAGIGILDDSRQWQYDYRLCNFDLKSTVDTLASIIFQRQNTLSSANSPLRANQVNLFGSFFKKTTQQHNNTALQAGLDTYTNKTI